VATCSADRSAIGTGYGRQHDRICDRCDLADERMSAQGQTFESLRLGAATGPVSMKMINSWPSVVDETQCSARTTVDFCASAAPSR